MSKIVNTMVQYFDEKQGKFVCIHWASREVNQATSANITKAVLDGLGSDGFSSQANMKPLQVISCLMDNCPTMRGEKSGVEPRLREVNPNLLDVAGDTVHTVHNAAATLFQPFGDFVSSVGRDIY